MTEIGRRYRPGNIVFFRCDFKAELPTSYIYVTPYFGLYWIFNGAGEMYLFTKSGPIYRNFRLRYPRLGGFDWGQGYPSSIKRFVDSCLLEDVYLGTLKITRDTGISFACDRSYEPLVTAPFQLLCTEWEESGARITPRMVPPTIH